EGFLSTNATGSSEKYTKLAIGIRQQLDASNSLDAPALFDLLFPKKAFDKAKLRLEISFLLRHLMRFLAQIALQKSAPFESALALRELADRGLAPSFAKYHLGSQKQLARTPHRDKPLYDYLAQVEADRFTEHSPRHQQARQTAIFETLEAFYLLGRLKLACAALNNQRVVDLTEHWPELAADVPPAALRQPDAHPTLGAYYAIMQMLSHPDTPAHYEHLKAFLQAHADDIPPTEAKEIFTYAQNYCIRQINRGQAAYLEELFFLYQSLLDRRLMLENGAFSPWHMKNIVAVALRLEKFDWTERFIHEYIRLVPKALRENARIYNLARLNFHRKNYAEAKQLLLQVEYEDIFYNLDAKTMLLKIYTEQADELALDAFARSFAAYLRRMRLLPAGTRDRYLNLVRYAQRLAQKGIQDPVTNAAIRTELEGRNDVADIRWLRGIVAK
ncbi:MAG: hypothetical protein AAF570_20645, partial [Bacteroidota bacterium]